MTLKFEAACPATPAQLAAIEGVNYYSPFNTAAYAAACAEAGQTICTFALRDDSDLVAGCLGLLGTGLLSRRLEIVSPPRLSQPSVFWDGVMAFSRAQKVWDLEIRSYGSEGVEIPALPGELTRRKRCEFVLDLSLPDPLSGISESIRRNLRRARKAGFSLHRTRERMALEDHFTLIQASMDRRQARGEEVPDDEAEDTEAVCFSEALLKSGAAEIFQATDGQRVMTSYVVVRSDFSACTYSSGVSPEGMHNGASAWLLTELAGLLKNEGTRWLNLGGAGEGETGIQYFKSGFGGQQVSLEEATFSFASPARQNLRTAARMIRRMVNSS
ncbi:MAG: GNAT family N-acetyltransferase [Blastocatellia bacterium]